MISHKREEELSVTAVNYKLAAKFCCAVVRCPRPYGRTQSSKVLLLSLHRWSGAHLNTSPLSLPVTSSCYVRAHTDTCPWGTSSSPDPVVFQALWRPLFQVLPLPGMSWDSTEGTLVWCHCDLSSDSLSSKPGARWKGSHMQQPFHLLKQRCPLQFGCHYSSMTSGDGCAFALPGWE